MEKFSFSDLLLAYFPLLFFFCNQFSLLIVYFLSSLISLIWSLFVLSFFFKTFHLIHYCYAKQDEKKKRKEKRRIKKNEKKKDIEKEKIKRNIATKNVYFTSVVFFGKKNIFLTFFLSIYSLKTKIH